MRPELPQPVQHLAVPAQAGIRFDHPCVGVRFDAVQFDFEEREAAFQLADPSAAVAEKLPVRGVGRVLRVEEGRERQDSSRDGIDALALLNALEKPLRVERRDASFVSFGKASAGSLQPLEILRQLRRIGARIEIVQVPDRERAKLRLWARRACGRCWRRFAAAFVLHIGPLECRGRPCFARPPL